MKAIHKVVSKDSLRPAMQYFQVKGGFVRATNGDMLIKMPVSEVFDDTIAENETLYFKGSEWAAGKFEKTGHVYREGFVFRTSKDKEIVGLTEDQLKEKIGEGYSHNFPDIDSAIHGLEYDKPVPMPQMGFNPFYMADLCESFNCHEKKFVFYFYGLTKGIVVKNAESEGFGYIMPCFPLECPEYPFKKH